jgi:hypothetical protein
VRGFSPTPFVSACVGAGVNVTRAKLDSQVSLYLSKMSASQHPQTEGTKASLREMVFT